MAGRAEAEGQNGNILTKYLSSLTKDHAKISKIDGCGGTVQQEIAFYPLDKEMLLIWA